jgi:4'-phosphopantetheinyl transferase
MVPGWRTSGFPPAPGKIGLPSADVHVWLLDLDQPDWLIGRLWETLDGQERARAARFVFSTDRAHYTAAHGLVRHVLAGYLGIPPADVIYGYGRHGKPYVVTADAPAAPRFNMSHSANVCLCAVTLDREVGVDIERIRVDRDYRGIADRYFSPAERAAILALPVERLVPAFYDCWTRKEAHLKATGDGLGVPLNSFDVLLIPETRSAPAAGRHGPRLMSLPPVPGFAAALAVWGEGCEVRALSLGPVNRIHATEPPTR